MTVLAQPIDSSANREKRRSSKKIRLLPIAILVLLSGAMLLTATIQSALLTIAMLASLGFLQLGASFYNAQLKEDLLALAMAALGTIAMLYLLA
ncbi:hypothetical protein FGL86_10670 [Pistricoccus aurantiacus]|uniref:Uncharacterized protein n=1 Tax=Pistricoccus aurantiacus TaxID=1883414 RepID=A0A5B8SQS9_9GAMM|nr:hypothetical protein [Pistricoccus aurantiacus]QEA39492.1 hypothetical protein FGL86_10670 [Pistricoccus aurantiacus]